MNMLLVGFLSAVSFSAAIAVPTPLPFLYGSMTDDTWSPLGVGSFGPELVLPKPMAYLTSIRLLDDEDFERGNVSVYRSDVDTRRGGDNQNQDWLRIRSSAMVVGTWNKVEDFEQVNGRQNTVQLIIPYSDTGRFWQ